MHFAVSFQMARQTNQLHSIARATSSRAGAFILAAATLMISGLLPASARPPPSRPTYRAGEAPVRYVGRDGGGLALAGKSPLIINVAAAKMNAPALELVARAMLCNWFVCLAIWKDTAKCIAIFWCLYAL